jgi:serine phosphatase RsbU (regulator of sigma subunit)
VSRGDRFFLYSDGLIESSPGGGRRAGIESLIEACVLHRSDPLGEAVAGIAARLRPHGKKAGDDLLLLGVEVTQ